ncbi:MAG: enoyl-CoA hydratase [Alphaproteobacteria bacterium]
MSLFNDTGCASRLAGGKMLALKTDGIGIVTFNQPEKRNAMSVEMWDGLAHILDDFAADDAVRSVILTGAGDKAFVSGADISQFEKLRNSAETTREYERLTGTGRQKLIEFPKPVICRIRGFCMGGGLAIAMSADIRIGSDESVYGIPAARLSVAYGLDQVRRLIALVGPAHAAMILYTARQIPAPYAERIGLINECVPAATLDETVLGIARSIAENAPLSIRASKMTIDTMLKDPAHRDMDRLRRQAQICSDSTDFREGRTAFMEKRRPNFVGR